eukprot:scaffold33822_cov19-Tisochrysis_lutea.AAC.1
MYGAHRRRCVGGQQGDQSCSGSRGPAPVACPPSSQTAGSDDGALQASLSCQAAGSNDGAVSHPSCSTIASVACPSCSQAAGSGGGMVSHPSFTAFMCVPPAPLSPSKRAAIYLPSFSSPASSALVSVFLPSDEVVSCIPCFSRGGQLRRRCTITGGFKLDKPSEQIGGSWGAHA